MYGMVKCPVHSVGSVMGICHGYGFEADSLSGRTM